MHSVLGHSQDGFDESLCLGMPADAPAIAPAPAPTVSLGPRCNDNLTALFNSGPVPASAPAEAPSVPPDMLPGVAPAVIPVEPPLPAPAVPPAPIEVVGPEEEEQQPEEAEGVAGERPRGRFSDAPARRGPAVCLCSASRPYLGLTSWCSDARKAPYLHPPLCLSKTTGTLRPGMSASQG